MRWKLKYFLFARQILSRMRVDYIRSEIKSHSKVTRLTQNLELHAFAPASSIYLLSWNICSCSFYANYIDLIQVTLELVQVFIVYVFFFFLLQIQSTLLGYKKRTLIYPIYNIGILSSCNINKISNIRYKISSYL